MTADATPHCTPPPLAAKKNDAPTVIGTALLVVNISPNRNSFQAVMKPKMKCRERSVGTPYCLPSNRRHIGLQLVAEVVSSCFGARQIRGADDARATAEFRRDEVGSDA